MVLQLDDDDEEAEQKIRMEIEATAEREIASALRAQGRAAIPDGMTPETATDAAGRAQRASGGVRDALRRALQNSADLGVSVAVEQLAGVGLGFDYTLANQAAADWVSQYTFELVRGINQTTERRLQSAISEWIQNGDTLRQLRDELSPVFGQQRAELIASTEVTRAYAEGNTVAWHTSGYVDEREWRTAVDELVCPVCGPLHGKRAALGEGFDDVDNPPAHPRCRCWVVPVVDA